MSIRQEPRARPGALWMQRPGFGRPGRGRWGLTARAGLRAQWGGVLGGLPSSGLRGCD